MFNSDLHMSCEQRKSSAAAAGSLLHTTMPHSSNKMFRNFACDHHFLICNTHCVCVFARIGYGILSAVYKYDDTRMMTKDKLKNKCGPSVKKFEFSSFKKV